MAIDNIDFQWNNATLEFRTYDGAAWSAWTPIVDNSLNPPIGTVVTNPYAAIVWLPCDGRTYPAADFPALAAARPDLVSGGVITLPTSGAIRAS